MADIEESKSKEKVDEPKKIPEAEKSLYDESVPMKASEEETKLGGDKTSEEVKQETSALEEKQEKQEKQAVFKKKQDTRFVNLSIFFIHDIFLN